MNSTNIRPSFEPGGLYLFGKGSACGPWTKKINSDHKLTGCFFNINCNLLDETVDYKLSDGELRVWGKCKI